MPDLTIDELARKRDRYRRLAARRTPLRRYFQRHAQECERARCLALLDRYKTSMPGFWMVPFDELARGTEPRAR